MVAPLSRETTNKLAVVAGVVSGGGGGVVGRIEARVVGCEDVPPINRECGASREIGLYLIREQI